MTGSPERTCIGCRMVDDKARLLRVVRVSDGGVNLDLRAGAGGRGAYVHPAPSCVEAATRKGALARALRTGIGPDELGRLRNAMSRGAL
jgi:uncharacterized protein